MNQPKQNRASTKWAMATVRATLFLSLMCIMVPAKAQYLFKEHYELKVSQFCLDCGNPQAEPPYDMASRLLTAFNQKSLDKIRGDIYVQILVDSTGRAQLLSADNRTNVKSKKLRLQEAVNSIVWKPAVGDGGYQSVQMLLRFEGDRFKIQRLSFSQRDNEPVKEPKKTDRKLSHTFKTYNTANSDLPWNMSRAVCEDTSGAIWMGTDQGLVCLKDGKMKVYNQKNSPLTTYPKYPNDMHAIMALATDSEGRLWVSQGCDLFIIDGDQWTHFNENNSPIDWCTGFGRDKQGNLWVPTFHGAYRYADNNWIVVDSINHPLPWNNVRIVFADSHNRKWIGTSKGSVVMVDGTPETFEDTPFGIKDITLSEMLEDSKGNLWMSVYGSDDEPTNAIRCFDSEGKWHEYECPLLKYWKECTIADIELDEKRGELWISVYHIGLLMYNIAQDKWELYTPENSLLPDSYIEDIHLDHEGHLWVATFGGFAVTE